MLLGMRIFRRKWASWILTRLQLDPRARISCAAELIMIHTSLTIAALSWPSRPGHREYPSTYIGSCKFPLAIGKCKHHRTRIQNVSLVVVVSVVNKGKSMWAHNTYICAVWSGPTGTKHILSTVVCIEYIECMAGRNSDPADLAEKTKYVNRRHNFQLESSQTSWKVCIMF